MAAFGLAVFAAVAGGVWHLAARARRHVDDVKGFSIAFPSGWEFQEGPKEGPALVALKALGLAEGSHRAAINVAVESLDSPLDDTAYMRRGIKIHGLNLEEYKPIGEGRLDIAGQEARWMRYTYVDGPKKRRFHAWQFYLVRKTRGYVITCTSDPAAFEIFRPDFEEIARSFRFE